MRNYFAFVSLLILFLCGCNSPDKEIRFDFEKYYNNYHVTGCFVLYDPRKDKFTIYNQDQTDQKFVPASTFKICNSLIGLETGVIPDEHFVLRWDSVVRQISSWNMDQDMATAFRNSTVWYYQELARRVGGEKMKYWLDKADYGNHDTSGGIDKFWLRGGLRITPMQQIGFLQRLHDEMLPFSKRSMNIVKQIMIAKDTSGYTIRAKTGWGFQEGKDIGWYVGYVENKEGVYYFSNCIQTADTNNREFGNARIAIVYDVLEDLKIIK